METIKTEQELRAVIGEEIPGLSEKVEARLDDFAVDFIGRAPFLVLSTADGAGRLDASRKGDASGFVAAEDDRTFNNGFRRSVGESAQANTLTRPQRSRRVCPQSSAGT